MPRAPDVALNTVGGWTETATTTDRYLLLRSPCGPHSVPCRHTPARSRPEDADCLAKDPAPSRAHEHARHQARIARHPSTSADGQRSMHRPPPATHAGAARASTPVRVQDIFAMLYWRS